MRAIRQALLPAAAFALCAVQAPADLHQDRRARIDRLLEAVRAGDEAGFAALVDPRDSEQDEQRTMIADYAADPSTYEDLTVASLRRFANACRYAGPDPDMIIEPEVFAGLYTCNGEPGHSLVAEFGADGRVAVGMTIRSPADRRAQVLFDERSRVASAIVDALLEAARSGDQAGFDALLGRGPGRRGPRLTDSRGAAPRSVALTSQALRPIAAECRRAPGERPREEVEVTGQVVQQAIFICGGTSRYHLFAGFEADAKVAWLRIENPREDS
jgi:hypothetical protein